MTAVAQPLAGVFYVPFVNWADLWLLLYKIVIIKNIDADKLKDKRKPTFTVKC